ncbi:MAG: hypothetical protein V1735_04630 [Nanoarchaeota archaeon]
MPTEPRPYVIPVHFPSAHEGDKEVILALMHGYLREHGDLDGRFGAELKVGLAARRNTVNVYGEGEEPATELVNLVVADINSRYHHDPHMQCVVGEPRIFGDQAPPAEAIAEAADQVDGTLIREMRDITRRLTEAERRIPPYEARIRQLETAVDEADQRATNRAGETVAVLTERLHTLEQRLAAARASHIPTGTYTQSFHDLFYKVEVERAEKMSAYYDRAQGLCAEHQLTPETLRELLPHLEAAFEDTPEYRQWRSKGGVALFETPPILKGREMFNLLKEQLAPWNGMTRALTILVYEENGDYRVTLPIKKKVAYSPFEQQLIAFVENGLTEYATKTTKGKPVSLLPPPIQSVDHDLVSFTVSRRPAAKEPRQDYLKIMLLGQLERQPFYNLGLGVEVPQTVLLRSSEQAPRRKVRARKAPA